MGVAAGLREGGIAPPTAAEPPVVPGPRRARSIVWFGVVGLATMTATINILYLTGSFYMLEVYDRVIPGRSVPTLVGLTVLAFSLFAFQGALDVLRSRVLVRLGAALDARLSDRVYRAVVTGPLKARLTGDGLLPLRDLDAVRGFLSGQGPGAFFDLPWIPLYLAICFAFHTWIGLTALVGALVLVAITAMTEIRTREPARRTSGLALTRNGLAESGRRNAEVLRVLGMSRRFGGIWGRANEAYMASQTRTADIVGGFGSLTKVTRTALQSAVLGIGAYLVIHQEASAGIMIASSILVARALAPVELAIGNWRGFVAARQSWSRLKVILTAAENEVEPLTLPPPTRSLQVESITGTPPGGKRLVVSDVTFSLQAGQGLGIVGPSASGKSSLVRMIVGAWTPLRGTLRLDGAAIDQWNEEALGRHLGYLPQDVELFAGTVADNIARFDPDPERADRVIAAARAAGVHDLVLRLPEGYETEIGESGTLLSSGQRQRVALARALYGDPFLVVLDEPNSNLDGEGEAALTSAIQGVRARGGIVLVVAHRPSALAAVDTVLVMVEGRAQSFGPRDEVLARLTKPAAVAAGAAAPFRVVAESKGHTS